MGLLNKAKQKLTGGGEEEIGLEEDIEVEMEEEEDDIEDVKFEEEQVEEQNNEPQIEWEDMEGFVEWSISKKGFAGPDVLAKKIMMRKMQNSMMFRDSIENGIHTMNQISESVSKLKEVKNNGNEKQEVDYEKLAKKTENANKAIKNVEELEGKEEMIVDRALSIGEEFVSGIGENKRKQQNRDINVESEHKEGEL